MKILIALALGLVIGAHVAPRPITEPPLEQIYKAYNHINIFEDGSYIGQSVDGQHERGCILIAKCNEWGNR